MAVNMKGAEQKGREEESSHDHRHHMNTQTTAALACTLGDKGFFATTTMAAVLQACSLQ